MRGLLHVVVYLYHSTAIMSLSLPRRQLFRSCLYTHSKSMYSCPNQCDNSYFLHPPPLPPPHLLPSPLPAPYHLPPYPQPLQAKNRANPRPHHPRHHPQRERCHPTRTLPKGRTGTKLPLQRPLRTHRSDPDNAKARPPRHGRRPRPHPHRPQTLATQDGNPRHPRPRPPFQNRENPPHRTPTPSQKPLHKD